MHHFTLATAIMLKLIVNKTDLMLANSKRAMYFHNLTVSITIGNTEILLINSVKNYIN